MQKHFEITRQRLQAFSNDSNLRGKLYLHRAPVQLLVYSSPERISFAEAMRGRYRPAKVGQKFGPVWSTHWFKVQAAIPRSWKGKEVHFLWNSSSEACVWKEGGPLQGLTGTASPGQRPIRNHFCLTRKARGGERVSFAVEMACNGLFGASGGDGLLFDQTFGALRQAEIAVFDREAWDLLWDFVVIADMAEHLPQPSPRAGQALHAANQMVNVCNLEDRSTWPKARAIAAEFYRARNGDSQHHVSAIGHAHIDTAWLWPLAETRRKCFRTFSTAVRYMEDYPEYKFVCSQAQQYDWIKKQWPGLYKKIKARVKEGRFIPAGGTWIEPDCNIPSGESLVRQFLVGQRFFRKEFGITCREFWNPDVFGYCGQLPQIMRGAGIEYFLTQKLSWNQFNKPASHTFHWEGIDGSRVLTHFPPADTYNSVANVKETLFHVRNYKDHERSNESYMLFGFGDGGGGPTWEMLEQLRRMKNVDGMPRVEIRSPRDFFQRLKADAKPLTCWRGELYFELHRGTYTTQAKNKLGNRRCELILRDAEFLSAMVLAERKGKYPSAELQELWEVVLLNQFHDILPGSSITEVYEDSAKHYREVLQRAETLREKAAQNLFKNGRRLIAINTLSRPRTEVVELPGSKKLTVATVPAMGYSVLESGARVEEPVTVSEKEREVVLENALVRAVFKKDGHLIGLFDKRAGRDAIEKGRLANHFALFDDEPLMFDAWDVDIYHLEKRYDLSGGQNLRILEKGPLRASLEVEFKISSQSWLKQRISLTAVSPRLDFSCEAEWRERHKFLKVEFPTTLQAENATYEIQFGNVQRPTHFNTTWDLARFEVCAHKWADLSEPTFGLALLNDCKYGHATHGGMMRLSLLRAPKSPDPKADMGRRQFRYALLPHPGNYRDGEVVEEAARFNSQLILRKAGPGPDKASWFGVSHPSVVIDTIKKAEDSNDLIVRLYEAHGVRRRVRFHSALKVKKVQRCNLLEEQDLLLKWDGDGVDLDFTPFQIMTLKLA